MVLLREAKAVFLAHKSQSKPRLIENWVFKEVASELTMVTGRNADAQQPHKSGATT